MFACGTEEVTLSGVTADGRVVLKGAEAVKLDRFKGYRAVRPCCRSGGYGRGDVAGRFARGYTGNRGYWRRGSLPRGEASNIEITASNRTIDLSGMEADTLTVTGSGSTIVVDGAVRAVSVNAGAAGNTLTLNKKVETLLCCGCRH